MDGFVVPNLRWRALLLPLAAAEDALARLDQCLRTSPIAEGWVSRSHYREACASTALDGALVSVEELILRQEQIGDIPSYDGFRQADFVLQTRRRIATTRASWAMSRDGLEALTGQAGGQEARSPRADERLEEQDTDPGAEDEWNTALAAIDAVLQRSTQRLEHIKARLSLPAIDNDQADALNRWQSVVFGEASTFPSILAAAILHDAWLTLNPAAPWLGRQLCAAYLRHRGKTHFLPCLAIGLQGRAHRRGVYRPLAQSAEERILETLDGLTAAAEQGLSDHDRWTTARETLLRKAEGRRKHSHLPALIDFVLRMPLITSASVARELHIAPRNALELIGALGLREITERGRFRAWVIL